MAEKELSYVVFSPAWMNQPVEWIPDDSNIADLITKQAEKRPEKTALICYDREVSFGELDELTNRLASGLISEFGVKKGDRVATMFPNCIQHTLAYLGINKAGAVATPINVMYREREIAYQLSDSGAETVIALDAFYPLIQKAKGTTPLKNIIVSNLRDFIPLQMQTSLLYLPLRRLVWKGLINWWSSWIKPLPNDLKLKSMVSAICR